MPAQFAQAAAAAVSAPAGTVPDGAAPVGAAPATRTTEGAPHRQAARTGTPQAPAQAPNSPAQQGLSGLQGLQGLNGLQAPQDAQGLQNLPPFHTPQHTTADAGQAERRDTGIYVDPVQRTAAVDGEQLDLTYLEFELLAHLVAHPHRVHTRDQLVTTVWGYGHVGDGRTVDVHVARLRRKLGTRHRQLIQTVRRVGYKYAPSLGR
ncbi:winged helix-turn-helix transcriptional regulator [Streptomyces sp. NA04227]|nr:winged helix-turn-helix transcriptional regulator [Streptomyces sp. NA04227]